ncbi:MAG TPA: hypothetical protein VOA41_07490 [Candidatus Dormibacteraeota bacterium]|nr:hypothetical protein [Candidatus Dormibacteraeota bacterium]
MSVFVFGPALQMAHDSGLTVFSKPDWKYVQRLGRTILDEVLVCEMSL